MSIDLKKTNNIHFVGIGGIGISALAKYFVWQKKNVSGSDLKDSDLLQKLSSLGATIVIGPQKEENVPDETELVIYTDAAPESNPERMIAKKNKIPQLSYFQALGVLSKGMRTIAISGCHGKTTTTAMTGLIFEAAKKDPTVIVGTKVQQFDGNVRMGKSNYFIVEADEYHAHMLELSPSVIILNNIDADHLDYYKDLDDIIAHFQTYVDRLPKKGVLIINADDPYIQKLTLPSCTILRYSLNDPDANLYATDLTIQQGTQAFTLYQRGKKIGVGELSVPGIHNISNALGAILAALHENIPVEIILKTLKSFTGTWRRFEILGELATKEKNKQGALVISDYAHHPTELRKTITAAREFYPRKKIVVAFQPHQTDRTTKLFSEFVDVLSNCEADILIINEIYGVAGREGGAQEVSSKDLVREIVKQVQHNAGESGVHAKEVYFTPDLEATKREILKNVNSDSVILVMGAGDIDSVARELI